MARRNIIRTKRALLAAVAAAGLCAAPARAEFSISAEADKKTVEINDSLNLTVTISADSASVPEPRLPQMTNFNVYSSGRSQNISIVNGKIATSVTFTYVLSPMFIGKQKIPSISVTHGRDKAFTQEIEVTVVRAGSQQQTPQSRQAQQRAARAGAQAQAQGGGGAQLFITAETDKRSAYPSEQINLTIRFYTSVPLTSNPQYLPPPFKNLIAEDLPPVRNGETTIKGRRYAYSEIKTAVFGLAEGAAEVLPATVIAQLHAETPMDPFDPNFFQKFFAMNSAQGVTRQVRSDPLSINILPLPAGAPPSFKDAVGRYSISADVDRKEAKAGEALNLSVRIGGSGNLKVLTAPRLPDMPDFKVYDTMSSLDISKADDVIGGKKTFTTILIPKREGRLTIPPIEFSYFDTEAKEYRETATRAIEITVLKGDGEGTKVSFAQGAQQAITPLASDIRYVSEKAAPPGFGSLAGSLAGVKLWFHFVPVLIALLAYWIERIQAFRIENPLLFRFRMARGRACKGLSCAREKLKLGLPAEAASALHASLLEYLSDKSGQKIGGMTRKKALALLKEKFPGAGDGALGEIGALWESLEALHYTPEGDQPERAREMVDRYSALVDRLEKEFKK